ncbi:MAG: hypothetical protein GY863_08230, partial [bacterium]|nr:hypothetical protein [bacterium]
MKNRSAFLALVILIAFLVPASVLYAQNGMQERFIELASVPAVTGHEYNMVEYIKSKLPSSFDVTTDNMGNLIAKTGRGEPDICIMSSVDEPGYIVSGIREDGYLTVHTTSSIPFSLFHQFHEGTRVDIITGSGSINGLVAIPSSHITRGKGDLTDLNDFILDVGARSKSQV